MDFIFDQGLFFISVKNIGDKPAYRISIDFDKSIFGVEGNKEITKLALFRNIEFLPPQKEIMTFVDSSESYFKREEPTKVLINITFFDEKGSKYKKKIYHDLEIYREIGYLKQSVDY